MKRQGGEVLSRGVPPPGIGDVGFDLSPGLDTKHTIYELCLPLVAFVAGADVKVLARRGLH